MSNLPRITAILLVFVVMCLQAIALPKPPRPPVPKPKRPNNSHLLSKAAAAKSLLLSKQNAGKASQHNAGPNSKNHQLLLQQQKNTVRLLHAAQARRGNTSVNNILVGNRRYASPGVFRSEDIETGSKSDGVGLEDQGINVGGRREAEELDDWMSNPFFLFWSE